ncbi:MAG: hypothetical protein KDK53_23195, partial [Maritimibacter sp.]|nr:hypothetical protein [Maritimibacter sp.]
PARRSAPRNVRSHRIRRRHHLDSGSSLNAGGFPDRVAGDILALGWEGLQALPTGFVPQQDKNYLVRFLMFPRARRWVVPKK